eukprot:5011595-Amphidinium_carterae.1
MPVSLHVAEDAPAGVTKLRGIAASPASGEHQVLKPKSTHHEQLKSGKRKYPERAAKVSIRRSPEKCGQIVAARIQSHEQSNARYRIQFVGDGGGRWLSSEGNFSKAQWT